MWRLWSDIIVALLLWALPSPAASGPTPPAEPACATTAGAAYIQRAQTVRKQPAAPLGLEQTAVDDALGGGLAANGSQLCCEGFDRWPNVDNGVTCGNCKALVLTKPYWSRCDRYCESFGHVCVEAAEETAENCEVKSTSRCDQPIAGTSDMLCTCRLPSGHASCPGAPTPAPPTQPVASGQCCKPFNEWPSVDNGVTCGGCRALVKTRDYGNRCDRYCESFGHVCIAAAEEMDENCEVKWTRPCDMEIEGTSDMLCTCQLPNPGGACPTPPPQPTLAPGGRIEIRGRQVLAGGVPLHLKGVAWNPVPKGSNKVDFRRFVEQDSELMARAGINAVRTYSHIGDRKVLDILWSRGIWVLNSVYNYGGGSTSSVANKVREVRDHPAILMWTVGNEWNYNGLYVGMSSGSSISKVAKVARIIKENDKTRPVASIYGEVPSQYTIESLTDIDVWGVNVYRGIGFDDTFGKYASRTGKPLFFGEYGADAYNARKKREDQAAQAEATRVLTEDIVRHSSVTGGVCLGGFVFEFADEWWKDDSGSRSRHDVGGIAPGGGPHPDYTFNEEWWGLVDIDRRPRLAFDAYAKVPVPVAA